MLGKDNSPPVRDVDRPDVNGVEPKMHAIAVKADEVLSPLAPVLMVTPSDNFSSHVSIRGSFDPRENWTNGIEYNSRHFRFTLHPDVGRYYENGATVTVELNLKYHTLPKFRKYKGTPDKVIAKIKAWMESAS